MTKGSLTDFSMNKVTKAHSFFMFVTPLLPFKMMSFIDGP